MVWSKNKKNIYTLHTSALLYKSCVQGRGLYITRTCFRDVLIRQLDRFDVIILFSKRSIFHGSATTVIIISFA